MIKKLSVTALFLMCLSVLSITAQANILITPTQVVFDDRERFADIFLANSSNESKSYVLSWQLLKMTEESGRYSRDEFVPEYDLTKYIRFAPKRVTLPPLGKQKVRLSFSRPSDIPEGDYHIHLKFKLVPLEYDVTKGKPIEKALVHVPINVHYTIPVVVRIGQPEINVSIGQIGLERDQVTGKINMNIPVERVGTAHSMLGYIRVYHINSDGVEALVGEVSNANIFPEIYNRNFSVPLTAEISGGRLRVDIRHYDKGNDVVLAEKIFDLE